MPLPDVKTFLATLPDKPGCYQMLAADGTVLYVGKAQNLKKRVSSYFKKNLDSVKTENLMSQVDNVELIVTHSDHEALILESHLIKKYKPRYNVLLRDDKSYPYLFLSDHPDYPRLDLYRGPKKVKGRYFGPYPSVVAVRDTLKLLQKLFKIRQCSDAFFRVRSRPCLQYQINRCTAPCVNYISPEAYQRDVKRAVLFLQGKSDRVIADLITEMRVQSTALEFEQAAHTRDLIQNLRKVQAQQFVNQNDGDIDVIAVVEKLGVICVGLLYLRAGRLIGTKAFFPKIPTNTSLSDVLSAFLTQYYLSGVEGEITPSKIIINQRLPDEAWLQTSLAKQLDKSLTLHAYARGKMQQWLKLCTTNAEQALTRHLADKAHFYQRVEALQRDLKLSALPQRFECFDISHTRGEATVASCVVFDTSGPLKRQYRRFNITGIAPGDDYAAMRAAITRRFKRLKANEQQLPDVLIIDGGKGQLNEAKLALEELQISGVVLFGISKGPSRKPGLEQLHLANRSVPIQLNSDAESLHLLQQIRDEAHRFAITGHRRQRAHARRRSILEDIPGIGAKRRAQLLTYFGGLKPLKKASQADIAKVPGISETLAGAIVKALQT